MTCKHCKQLSSPHKASKSGQMAHEGTRHQTPKHTWTSFVSLSSTGATSSEGPAGGVKQHAVVPLLTLSHVIATCHFSPAGVLHLHPPGPLMHQLLSPTSRPSIQPAPPRPPLTQHERVLHSGGSGLSGELVEQGAHNGSAGTVGVQEECVEVGQQRIPAAKPKECTAVCNKRRRACSGVQEQRVQVGQQGIPAARSMGCRDAS